MKNDKFTSKDLEKILSNPFYCLDQIHPIFAVRHKKLIDKKQWISVSEKLIKEIGVKKWLKRLLENLEGKYI